MMSSRACGQNNHQERRPLRPSCRGGWLAYKNDMRILFVDDAESRCKAFLPRAIGHTVDIAMDEGTAIKRLTANAYDAVLLDHDLSEHQYGEDLEIGGTTIAKFIAKEARRFQRTRFIIHSLNDPGARRMERIIRDAGLTVTRQPFAWQHIKFS